MAVIRVLLVDDNAIVRRGIASLLMEADGIEVVGEAGDGREAIARRARRKPDVVCLDVRMPVMDGVAAAKPLSEHAKVLMLSYSEDEPLVTGAISNGASGYLVHGRFEPDELESRIKADPPRRDGPLARRSRPRCSTRCGARPGPPTTSARRAWARSPRASARS